MPQPAVRLESRPIDYEVLWADLTKRLRLLLADTDSKLRTVSPAELGFHQGRASDCEELLALMQALRVAASGMPQQP